MKRLHPAVYVVLALLALAPVALRAVAWWRVPRPQSLDPTLAAAGEKLFKHEWTPNDPLANGGDGLGPVYNATSCVACHSKGGVGGSGGLDSNVTTFTVQPTVAGGKPREGVVHAHGSRFQETLADVSPELPPLSRPTLAQVVNLAGSHTECLRMPPRVHVSQRNTPALFGDRLIDAITDEEIIANERRERLQWGLAPTGREDVPVGRALRRGNGRVGHFGWKAQSASLAEFVQAACANELGLGNPGQAQPVPLSRAEYRAPGLDLTLEQCNQLTAFVDALPRPVERLPEKPAAREQVLAGKKLFSAIGCADCHTPDVGSVDGIYSDLLLHRMGADLQGGGSYNDPVRPTTPDTPSDDGASPFEWRTPPLWGVADSAPYLHDGRAATLEDAIKQHGGQASAAQRRFETMSQGEQWQLITFLKTLRAP
jgi:CxxC motif-containing protein (DUF1111 family)